MRRKKNERRIRLLEKDIALSASLPPNDYTLRVKSAPVIYSHRTHYTPSLYASQSTRAFMSLLVFDASQALPPELVYAHLRVATPNHQTTKRPPTNPRA